jgi:PleD family two-component response regulator
MNQTNPRTILVAVNDIFFYTKVRDVLRANGYTIEKARTQQDIADKASSIAPSIIILDMNDMAVNSFQALETLKTDSRLNAIPTLAFANHEEVDTWNRARALGVTKIVSRNEMSAHLRELVEEIVTKVNKS